jgi:hypothetical protein
LYINVVSSDILTQGELPVDRGELLQVPPFQRFWFSAGATPPTRIDENQSKKCRPAYSESFEPGMEPIMGGNFESMVNEMVRWNTTPEIMERTPAAEAPETILDDGDEFDPEDEITPWPCSGRSDSTGEKNDRPRVT